MPAVLLCRVDMARHINFDMAMGINPLLLTNLALAGVLAFVILVAM